MPIIDGQGLRETYGETVAVADVSFSVDQGEIFGILGPNGAGKTTTVECLQGLRSRDGGVVRILDMDPDRKPDDLRRVVGSYLVNPIQNPWIGRDGGVLPYAVLAGMVVVGAAGATALLRRG